MVCFSSPFSFSFRLISVAETFGNAAGTGWRCAGYDAHGQMVANVLSVTANSQTTTQTVLQSYNDVGEPTTLTYPDGEIVTSTYSIEKKTLYRW